MTRPCDPVGAVEIAQRLGVARKTVDQWRQRESVDFPAPRWQVGGRPAWNWDDVAAWAKATGRACRSTWPSLWCSISRSSAGIWTQLLKDGET